MKRKEFEKCPEINDVFDTYLWEPISFIFAKAFARKGWSPNVATIISLIFGVSGGVLFAFHNLWLNIAGSVLVLFSIIFDDADGQIARINNSSSIFGRFLDGFCDGIVYASIYIGFAVHIMRDNIPFTNIPWSWWIFLVGVPVAIYFHPRQARICDYYKNVYMYLIGVHNELLSSKEVDEKIKNEKLTWFKKIILKQYLVYTKQQEKESPITQSLLKKIRENGNVIPEKVSQEFKKHVPLMRFANIEAVSFRTFVLIALLLTGQGCWLFLVIIFILEPINLIIQWRFSRISKKALEECFNEVKI